MSDFSDVEAASFRFLAFSFEATGASLPSKPPDADAEFDGCDSAKELEPIDGDCCDPVLDDSIAGAPALDEGVALGDLLDVLEPDDESMPAA